MLRQMLRKKTVDVNAQKHAKLEAPKRTVKVNAQKHAKANAKKNLLK
jgi:hypothetical protein